MGKKLFIYDYCVHDWSEETLISVLAHLFLSPNYYIHHTCCWMLSEFLIEYEYIYLYILFGRLIHINFD